MKPACARKTNLRSSWEIPGSTKEMLEPFDVLFSFFELLQVSCHPSTEVTEFFEYMQVSCTDALMH